MPKLIALDDDGVIADTNQVKAGIVTAGDWAALVVVLQGLVGGKV